MKEKRTKKESKKKASKENTTTSAVNACEENENWQSQDIDWFVHYWNEQRLANNSRLYELPFLSDKQKKELKRCQAHWGKQFVRQAVINAMRSDYINGRTGKRMVFSMDWFLNKSNFPNIVQGKYNDLEPEARKPTAEELRRQAEEEKKLKAEEQRRQAAEIERQIREEQRRRRDEMYANAARGEELQRILAEIKLPQLRENEKI